MNLRVKLFKDNLCILKLCYIEKNVYPPSISSIDSNLYNTNFFFYKMLNTNFVWL